MGVWVGVSLTATIDLAPLAGPASLLAAPSHASLPTLCLLPFLQLSPLHGLSYWQRFPQTLAVYALFRPGDHHLLPAPE